MRHEETLYDPTPDPRLEAALRSLEDEPPLESVDWERLRGSIRSRAELPLAGRRQRPASRSTGRGIMRSRIWRPLVPLAAAASLALAVWVASDVGGSQEVAAAGMPSVEEVFRSDLSDQEVSRLVSGGADPEALLLIALDEP